MRIRSAHEVKRAIPREKRRNATGSLVNHLKAKKFKTTPNQWHSYEVRAEGGMFLVKLDGKTLLKGKDATHAVGHIGLQYNKDKKIEFRNLKLKPLGSATDLQRQGPERVAKGE